MLFVSRDADAADLARRVKTAFEPFGKAVEVPVSLAMGWASFDGAQDRELSDTQKRDDSAMYKDKLQIKAPPLPEAMKSARFGPMPTGACRLRGPRSP